MPTESDYRLLFHQCPAILLVLTPDLVMVEATEARLRATGTTRPEVIGKHLFEVFPDNPEDPAATGVRNLRASLERVLRTGKPDTMAVQKYDIRLPERGGKFEERYWSPLNVPVFTPGGRIQYVIHRVEDVTDFVRLKQHDLRQSQRAAELQDSHDRMQAEIFRRGQEIQAANEALRALDAAKTHFFNNASHELRTPLMLILDPLEEVLADRDHLPPEAARQLELALRNARRMRKLVSGLLDFARIEAGRMQPELAATDLGELTREIVEGFRPVIERAGLRLRTDYGKLADFAVDPAMWEKIVLNLLSNAVKFTNAGEIAVLLAFREGEAELVVADTGTGMPPEDAARIFERFYQVPGRSGRNAEGTGLGLALVKELTTLMGGRVRVETQPGRGSRFIIRLPSAAQPSTVAGGRPPAGSPLAGAYAAEAAAWNARSTPPPASPATAPDHPQGLVLVVDDNADMRSHLAHLLGERFTVHAVGSVDAAWAALDRHRPDLLITDIMMPQVDGLEFVRQLRAHGDWRTLPVLVVTARAEESINVAGFESGADDFLIKPFGARELLARVEAHIKLARLRNAAAENERALREEAERERRRLEGLIAGITDAFALFDRDFRFLYVNAREAELLQRPAHELVHRILWDALPAGARPVIEPQLRRALLLKAPVVFEYYDRNRDLWFEKRAYGVEGGVAVLSADITGRKQAEKLALAKYRIVRALAAASHTKEAAIAVLTHLVEATGANIACFWLIGPEGPPELAGAVPAGGSSGPHARFIAGETGAGRAPVSLFADRVRVSRGVIWVADLDAEPGLARKEAARAAGLRSAIGLPVWIADEPIGVVELLLTRRFLPSDAVLQMLDDTGGEISHFIRRRRAEAEQRRLGSIIHTSNDAIIATNLEGTVTSWNAGAERLYGYSAAEAVGEKMDRVVPEDRREEVAQARSRVIRGERLEPFETVRKRRDGSLVQVSLSLSPIFDEANRLSGISAIGRDITAQKRAEAIERQNQELQQANRRALEASEMKTQFLASMSHELRTPLHGIIGFSEFLVDERAGPLSPQQKEYLEDVLKSAQHLLRLINNVLDISKVEAGQLELFPEEQVLAPLIEEVCAIVRPLAEKQKVQLQFVPDSSDFVVMIDPLRLRQVLYNLIANAVQYNRPGGSVEVRVAFNHDNHFEIAVIDTGIGLGPADQKVIFDEFRQLMTPSRAKGTGLGLAVTKRLVRCMHGTIRVESELGRGSCFTVTFPVIAPAGECAP